MSKRQNSFQVSISLGLQKTFQGKHLKPEILKLIMEDFNFVSQNELKKTLDSLEIEDRGRKSSVQNYKAIIKSNLGTELAIWSIYIKTSTLVTARSLGKALSSNLFNVSNPIDPRLTVRPIETLKRLKETVNRSSEFSVIGSNWYPNLLKKSKVTPLAILTSKTFTETKTERELIPK